MPWGSDSSGVVEGRKVLECGETVKGCSNLPLTQMNPQANTPIPCRCGKSTRGSPKADNAQGAAFSQQASLRS